MAMCPDLTRDGEKIPRNVYLYLFLAALESGFEATSGRSGLLFSLYVKKDTRGGKVCWRQRISKGRK